MDKWERVRLGDVLYYEQPTKYIVQSTDYNDNYITPVLTAGQSFILGYTDEEDNIFSDNLPVIIFDDFTTAIKYVDFPFKVKSSAMKILKASKYADIKYLYYHMNRITVDTELHKRYWISMYSNIQIPLPPLSVQQKIADILDRASTLIEKRKAQIEKLDLLVKSRFIEMFGDPVMNPLGWEVKRLGELGLWGSGGTPPRVNNEYFTGNINWYSAGELNELILSDSQEKITDEAIINTSAKLFPANSLFIGMYDTAAFKMGITTTPASSNQACANIAPDIEKINIYWLYYILSEMRSSFLHMRRGIRQKNLNLGMIKDFIIPLPPLPLQNDFAAFVECVEVQKDKMRQGLSKMELNYKSLMQKCFDGEIF